MAVSSKKKKIALKAVFSLAFIYVLFSFVQGNQLLLMFQRINWFYLSLSLLLTPVMIAVSCCKWMMILNAGQNNVPFLTLFRIYLIGYFFSNMLPSTVGGDVVRSYYTGKIIQDQSYSAIAIFIERFSGIFFLFLLVLFAPLVKPSLYLSPFVFVPVIASLILTLSTLWMAKVKKPFVFADVIVASGLKVFRKTMVLFGRKDPQVFIGTIEDHYKAFIQRLEKLHLKVVQAFETIFKDKILFLKLTFVTALFYLLTWVNVSLALLAFGVNHQFSDICALVPTILFVAHFPVTILGNLGFFESVFVFYLLLVDIPGNGSLAMGLLLRMKMLLIGIVGFYVYLVYKHATGDDAKQLGAVDEKKHLSSDVKKESPENDSC
ncbi:hypothetical protein UWK_02472 [Desulfocapsa sulfexigens DSM 10523]|uniref:Uncharacterized protein n=1 Tax=Desulfocapsa sulfexigens (strain DSM 10523 / SB164P1) TaxID=1167006 RepID=M1NHD2_DESSD|nr:lysylphosphatidylglycerol synthase transmembrane domain-containing protein [Desulfocapsa sulfexigens]AGF79009.1 hypothetical protein UWK_02472 [Desulfocapsa sulfexigens DSM 10523]